MNTFGFVDLNLPLPGSNEAFQVVDHRERLAAAQALGVGDSRTWRTSLSVPDTPLERRLRTCRIVTHGHCFRPGHSRA